MAVEFNGNFFNGTHESPVYVPPALQTVRTHFAGVIGESEIRLGAKSRPIYIPILLHDKYPTSALLFAALDLMDSLVGDHGELRINALPYGGVPRVFPNCTFEGFAKGQSPDTGPLADNVGLLDGTKPSWWVQGVLQFHQLSTQEE